MGSHTPRAGLRGAYTIRARPLGPSDYAIGRDARLTWINSPSPLHA